MGSGSNLLIADEGVRGLVLKLDGRARARSSTRATASSAAAAPGCPQAAARAAALGLTGLEFGVNIPGTVGGAVKMNANAYGGELGRVLEWVDVATPRRHATGARPTELGFAYRRSNLGPREIVARASFALEPRRPRRGQGHARRACARQRKAAQPSGIKTFGSTFKNPDDPRAEGRTAGQLLEEAGCRGLRSAAPASRRSTPTSSRTCGDGDHRRRARADGRGPPARAGALRGGARARGAAPRRGRRHGARGDAVSAATLATRASGAAAPGAARACRRASRAAPCCCSRCCVLAGLSASGSATPRSSQVQHVQVTGLTTTDARARSGAR